MNKEIEKNGKIIKFSNSDKTFWPEESYTKEDLLNYYLSVSKYILPYLKDRPQSLNRFPDGIEGFNFYQKNVEDAPDWVKTVKIWSEFNNDNINYVICNDEATLTYLVNLGCIEMNVWSSKAEKLENPNYMVIDLDPEDISFDEVIKVALTFREVFDLLEIVSYPKTSGASGIHIFVPTGQKYHYEQVKGFAKLISAIVNSKLPNITSLERRPEKRKKRVYLDYRQNNKGATMASVYSVRPKPGAPVSMPLEWSEIKIGLKPADFNMENALVRLVEKGDIFQPVLGKEIDIETALKRLNELS